MCNNISRPKLQIGHLRLVQDGCDVVASGGDEHVGRVGPSVAELLRGQGPGDNRAISEGRPLSISPVCSVLVLVLVFEWSRQRRFHSRSSCRSRCRQDEPSPHAEAGQEHEGLQHGDFQVDRRKQDSQSKFGPGRAAHLIYVLTGQCGSGQVEGELVHQVAHRVCCRQLYHR